MFLVKICWVTLLWAKPAKLPVETFWAHPFQCRSCHAVQYDFWEKTHHASAYVTLLNQSQHFDPECIACHSLGFRHPGGYQKVRDSVRGKVSSTELADALEPRTEPLANLRKRYHEKIHEWEKDSKIEKNFLGVQCEHCHGVRGVHPGGAKSKKVSIVTCKNCHVSERSPHFQASWLAKIACPPLQKK